MRIIYTILFITINILINGCMKPINITVPDSIKHFQAMPVFGTENSWKLDFGGVHVFKIQDLDSRILLVDPRNSSYNIKSFEFTMNTIGNTLHQCYCEFPIKNKDDNTLRCIYQDIYNQLDSGQLTDSLISSSFADITIKEYFEYDGKLPDSKVVLVGYLFKYSGKYVGLVDISNMNDETVWIDPSLELRKQVIIAAGATSIILKHRKWYY